jgi:hypothetical protein
MTSAEGGLGDIVRVVDYAGMAAYDHLSPHSPGGVSTDGSIEMDYPAILTKRP